VFLAGPTQKVGDVTVDEAVLAALADTIDTTGPDGVPPTGSGARPGAVAPEVATRQ